MQCRKRIELGFGWAKSIGSIRQVMVRGLRRVDQLFLLNMAAYKERIIRRDVHPVTGKQK